MTKTIQVFEVLFHSDNPALAYAGAAGDGSFIPSGDWLNPCKSD